MLNTMDTFQNEGFKIERNGEVITLTKEEMSYFRYLEQAIDGRESLERYREFADEDDKPVIDSMINNMGVCFEIEDDILDDIYMNIGDIEDYIIRHYIKKYRK